MYSDIEHVSWPCMTYTNISLPFTGYAFNFEVADWYVQGSFVCIGNNMTLSVIWC